LCALAAEGRPSCSPYLIHSPYIPFLLQGVVVFLPCFLCPMVARRDDVKNVSTTPSASPFLLRQRSPSGFLFQPLSPLSPLLSVQYLRNPKCLPRLRSWTFSFKGSRDSGPWYGNSLSFITLTVFQLCSFFTLPPSNKTHRCNP